jgi:hypothetical protein
MAGFESLGKMLTIVGGLLALVGGLLWLLSKTGLPGRLPGDILIERPGSSCAIPLASSIILSILLTIVANVIIRFLRR